ncbi:transmembrane protein, putative [Medicago truncatula]|uniref:Transmembrane protein, putative n=1 Tax=Medicago truncatula TaxID=3880 RepID=G7J6F1_MEDTR|nr:transmembrane protein, putative [Medicago truncatula]
MSLTCQFMIKKVSPWDTLNLLVYTFYIVFLNGQLYVAISRVASRNGLKILLLDEDGVCIDSTSNGVTFVPATRTDLMRMHFSLGGVCFRDS